MHTLLLAALLSCTSTPPSARLQTVGTFANPEMSIDGDGPVHQLSSVTMRSAARFDLHDSNLPESAAAAERIEVTLEPRGKRGAATVTLPFRLDAAAEATLGRDLEVSVDGRPLRFRSMGSGPNSWHMKNKREIVIQSPGSQAVLEYSGANRLLDRLVASKSGLSPSDFVEHSLTLKGQTRHGMLLSSPSKASWQVEIPPGATFEGVLALQPASIGVSRSDGAAAILSVVTDGEMEEVARTDATASFEPWKVDLSAYSGRTVDLVLSTEVIGTPDWDYVFIGAPTVWGTPPAEVRRVLVIGLDTTRPDKLGWYGNPTRPTPELDRIANESAVFTEAWCPAPRTRPSFRSATTGRYPLEAVGAENIGAVFQRNGFATAGIVANIHLQPRFDFDDGFDSWKFEGRARANEQVDDAIAFFDGTRDRDSYLFLHFMDPHIPYVPPQSYAEKFVTDPDPELPAGFNRTDVNRWGRRGELSDKRKSHIRALYDAELAFTSHEIGRLMDHLDGLPGKTLLVIHSDHGEEFWEHDGFEHNHTVYDEVTRAVLMFRPPGGTRGGPLALEQVATLADIAPTLYDFMGFDDLPTTDGISLRSSIDGSESVPRDLGVAHIRFGHERWAVVADGHKYIAWTGTGREELYAVADHPDESEDLATTKDLEPWRAALVRAHPGMEAGPGWRISINLAKNSEPVVWALPRPAVDAGIIDPESLLPSRSNLAWGEAPKRRSVDVATASLSADRKTLTITPGEAPKGMAYVRFAEPTPPTKTANQGGVDLDLRPSGEGLQYVGAVGTRIDVNAGFVLVPPPGEAVRMQALAGTLQSTDQAEVCRLCLLGYNEGEECLGCEGYNP